MATSKRGENIITTDDGTIIAVGDRLVFRSRSGQLIGRLSGDETSALLEICTRLRELKDPRRSVVLPGGWLLVRYNDNGSIRVAFDRSTHVPILVLTTLILQTIIDTLQTTMGEAAYSEQWESFSWCPQRGWLSPPHFVDRSCVSSADGSYRR